MLMTKCASVCVPGTETFLMIIRLITGTYSEVDSATECKLCKKGSYNEQAENTDCKVRKDSLSGKIE